MVGFNENHTCYYSNTFGKNRNSIKMSYNDRIDVSEGSDVNKGSTSRECIICHYWYLCNGCQYLLMISMNLNNIAI